MKSEKTTMVGWTLRVFESCVLECTRPMALRALLGLGKTRRWLAVTFARKLHSATAGTCLHKEGMGQGRDAASKTNLHPPPKSPPHPTTDQSG